MVTIGVCLFCLKGNTTAEDILLNLAGMGAVVVGLVPTHMIDRCGLDSHQLSQSALEIKNNVTAVLIVGAVASAFIACLGRREERSPLDAVGYGLAVVFYVAVAVVFWADPEYFVSHAHNVAAGLMFGCITLAVLSNGREVRDQNDKRWYHRLYLAIAATMGVVTAAFFIAKCLGSNLGLLWLEAALILLFAAFWITQSRELWHEGLR